MQGDFAWADTMYGRPGILRREVLLSALCVLATATAFDMIQSGAQGLSPACQSGQQIQFQHEHSAA